MQGAGHIGPCRCGTGPDAHNTTKDGKIDRKANLQQVAETEPMSSGLDAAREEIRRLTEELRELERSLGEG